LSMNCELKL